MALKHLAIYEMVNLTKSWVTPAHRVRLAFERIPVLTALLPSVEEVMALLLMLQRMELIASISKLSKSQVKLDLVHDEYARAVDAILVAYIHLARAHDDQKRVEQLTSLRAFLFPHQLRVVNFSYRKEAGQADTLSSRMKSEHDQALSAIPMQKGTLLDTVKTWLEAGMALGDLEDQRLDNKIEGHNLNMNEVRSEWIRMIQTVKSNVAFAKIDDPVINQALERIDVAAAAAAPTDSDDSDEDDDGHVEWDVDGNGHGDGTWDGDVDVDPEPTDEPGDDLMGDPNGEPTGEPMDEPMGRIPAPQASLGAAPGAESKDSANTPAAE